MSKQAQQLQKEFPLYQNHNNHPQYPQGTPNSESNGAAPGVPSSDFDPGIEVVNACTFFDQQFPLYWIVQSILVWGQPTVIGGPRKTLKTGLVIDLALSIATGSWFLNRFPVDYRCNVWALFGESNQPTVQQAASIIAAAKQVDPRHPALNLSFRLPRLSDDRHLQWLARRTRELQAGVVILDPLYLSLLAANRSIDPRSLYSIGPFLLSVAEAIMEAGAMPIFVHHTTKGKRNGSATELDDLAFAGIQEFARGWILLSRRSAYQPRSGLHELTMAVGGSVGFSDRFLVNVHEGDANGGFRGPEWRVEFVPEGQPPSSSTKEDRLRQVLADCHPEAETLSVLAKRAKTSHADARDALQKLIATGEVVQTTVLKPAGNAPPREQEGFMLNCHPFNGHPGGHSPTAGTDNSGPGNPGQS